MTSIIHSKSWDLLKKHYEHISPQHIRDFFNHDARRSDKFSLKFDDLLFDFSKNKITEETLALLYGLAKQSELKIWISKLFNGEKINFTEKRAALHVALRNRSNTPILFDGKDVMPSVNRVLNKMRFFSDSIRSGELKGFTGKKFTAVVNIGIGGSDLGPAMVCHALKSYGEKSIKPIFVSNIDGYDIAQALDQCDPETTLFIVASKTFTTQETMTNAFTARKWLADSLGIDAVKNHFVAISTNEAAVTAFGISPEYTFEFWDWVGGRYSLWSSIGLSIAIYIGMDQFENLLDGAHEIDNHFRDAPFEENIPVTLAMIGVWHINFFGYNTLAVLPYDQGLSLLPSYLQQADMESNGKFIGRDGEKVCLHTGPIVWGDAGTNGQHAFYQLIHQGTDIIPTDFIMPANTQYSVGSEKDQHHKILFSNYVAQSRALMFGKTKEKVRAELVRSQNDVDGLEDIIPHKSFEGDRPSNSFLFKKLTPKSLGRLLAIYEHKIFVQGIIWNINSFDQWGVEYGKQLASLILPELNNQNETNGFDSSTNNLINYFKKST
ncbi:glucose-6-phosphate isomerase [Methylophilaceae bacterium]|nr:glucose-6-phosphate isomerase [Methylophilaceae bacterium]